MRLNSLIQLLIACTTLSFGLIAKADDVKPAPTATLSAEQSAFFEGKIRPIFADKCYKCHSIEQNKTKGGLTLDTRDGWTKGGDTGPTLVPGDTEKSLLLKAVSYKDEDLQMPPKDKGGKLTDAQIADLTAWVKMGAPDPRIPSAGGVKLTGLTAQARAHWAYQPVKSKPAPSVSAKNKAWVANPIDAFILARLEANGMSPAKAATREALLRRATYDLIGLPPTPDELKAFENDRTPKAFEKVVDRLLASPHYGERWGRYWLDTARYADTTGSDSKSDDYRYVYAWGYRDYVIKAFSDDKPYDRFLQEQIAADLLPDADLHPDTLAGLGFLTVGKRFQNVNDTIDERIDTLCKATMAMTVSCARCHNHKFDPIPTADYYSLHGIFSSIAEPTIKPAIGTPPTSAQVADYQKKRSTIEEGNRQIYFDYASEVSSDFRKKATGYVLSSFYSGGKYKDPAKKVEAIKEFKLEGDISNGQRLTEAKINKDSPVFAPVLWFAALDPGSFSEHAGEVLDRIHSGGDGKIKLNPLVMKAFEGVSASSLTNMHDVAAIYGRLFGSVTLEHRGQEFLKANRSATTLDIKGFDDPTTELLKTPFPLEPAPAITTDHLKSIMTKLFLGEGAYGKFLFASLNDLDLTHPGAPLRAMIVSDLPKPVESPIFVRGDSNNKGERVPHRFLEILAGPDRKPFASLSGRLELAQAIGSKDNPLTARVMINRMWMHHFGDGFIRTPDDMGVQSAEKDSNNQPQPPVQVELLDYLAARFMDEGWSIKSIHKLIMLSNTYQQSSDTNTQYAIKDPGNRLLWRANLRRLDFEAIRDSMLQFSGHLDPTIGGRPVNISDEPYSNRRTIYGFVDRGNVPELLRQFDYADPNRPNSQRTSTIVPQQALFFMNSPMSADVARKVCSRPEFVNAGDDFARVKAIYEVLYQRKPKEREVNLAAAFYNAHLGTPDPASAGKTPARRAASSKQVIPDKADMMKGGSDKRTLTNEGYTVDRKPLTVWEEYAQSLLMTNEVVYVH